MNISLNWLSDHLDLSGRSVQELSDLLTFAGIEVEGIESKGVQSDKVVVAQVQSFVPHPNADRLRLCQVDDGSGKPRQIVCGAKNFNPGDKVPLALPGAVMPGGFEIKESPLRGVLSQGMMCSGQELGLGQDHEGLLILQADAPVGKPLKDWMDSDTLFELEITPNRPDCLSHRGVARELAALAKLPLKQSPTVTHTSKTKASSEIVLQDTQGCPFYTARIIRGVRIGPSPDWLCKKLESIGLRAINNIVDITNYVLMEMGQPLHAFDLAKLNGGITVRNAAAGETFVALDGKSYALGAEDLVIADSAAAVAIAGVMGGLDSGVTESTTDILLESAYFHFTRIRHTSRKLGLMSDSSYRFERGVDPEQILGASEMATKLILELCGGTAEEFIQTAGEPPVLTKPVTLDLPRCQSLLGVEIGEEESAGILESLGLKRQQGLTFAIPGYRQDLQRSVDLVEEIARVYGIDKIPSQRQGTYAQESTADETHDFVRNLKLALVGAGFYEAQTIKLISSAQLAQALGTNPGPMEAVPLKNPLSDDHTHLRPSLAPGLLATAANNLRHGATTLRFFESGTVFTKSKRNEPDEKLNLALLLSGPATDAAWCKPTPDIADVHDLRGILESFFPNTDLRFKPTRKAGELLLSSQVMLNGKPVGLVGQVRPGQVREMDGRHALYLAELNVDQIQKALKRDVRFAEMPKYPASTRDVALAVPQEVTHGQVDDFFAAQRSKEPFLVDVSLFDVYSGEKVAAGTKSMAYRLTYREPSRTLESAEVDTSHQRILEALKKTLSVTIR